MLEFIQVLSFQLVNGRYSALRSGPTVQSRLGLPSKQRRKSITRQAKSIKRAFLAETSRARFIGALLWSKKDRFRSRTFVRPAGTSRPLKSVSAPKTWGEQQASRIAGWAFGTNARASQTRSLFASPCKVKACSQSCGKKITCLQRIGGPRVGAGIVYGANKAHLDTYTPGATSVRVLRIPLRPSN